MVGLIQNNIVEVIIGYLLITGCFIAYHMYKAPELDDDFNEIKKDKKK
jgi:hypothetical protein